MLSIYTKYIFSTLLFFSVFCTYSQSTSFGDDPVEWATNKAPEIAEAAKNSTSDLIILDEQTNFYFFSSNNERIDKQFILKINSQKGLTELSNYKLPESFVFGHDADYYKQGRNKRITTPYTNQYQVLRFGARKFSKGKWTAVTFKLKYETIRWIKNSGEFTNDELTNFQLLNISVGDIVEIYYQSQFVSNYGSNLFYFNSKHPKLQCEFNFIYRINKNLAEQAFILPIYVKDSVTTKIEVSDKDYVTKTDKILIKDLKGINYPANSNCGKTLPHVFVDFNFYRTVLNSYPTGGGGRIYDYTLIRAKHFEWLIHTDTTNYYTKIYDKHSAALHKFVSSLPPLGSDSANIVFFKALCDTLNNFTYISANHLFYNQSNLYEVSTSDHLLKRRLKGNTLTHIYEDILFDNNIFHYIVNVEDKRFGEHNASYRAHYAYEQKLVAIPNKNSYMYFMPRLEGMKYHLNELPFYFEGIIGALQPKNFQDDTKNKETKFFKFIKTHKGTFNENTRTENGTVKITMDSLKADLTIKESLSGQFSTVLRHLYLNEYIDSTISPHYFKKCIDKPYASNAKIKFSSRITEFPFRYTFNCTEKVTLQSKTVLDLKNWFSFTLSKNVLPEIPNHDYYFDFDFSDSYNFLLDFNGPVELTNAGDFTRNISNPYFELQSEIVKNSESNYLLKVKVQVKELKIPVEKADLLMALVKELDGLNNFSLSITKK